MEEVSKEAKRVNTWKWTQLFPGFFIVGKFSKTTESEKPKEMGASGRSQHKRIHYFGSFRIYYLV